MLFRLSPLSIKLYFNFEIVKNMSKIDWNDDIVFHAYKDYCSVFYYKGSSLLPLATESYFIPWNINTNSLKSGKIILNKK